MVNKFPKYILSLLLTVVVTSQGMGQGGGLCPDNLDFEFGDFTNWNARTGTVSVVGGVNTINWTGNVPVAGRHTIISPLTSTPDPYGFFPTMCPNGSNYCVKLGNAMTGSQAEGLDY